MIKKILVPLDGLVQSNTAIKYGIYIAKKLDAVIGGLHVLDINLFQGPLFTDMSGAVSMPYDGFIDALEKPLQERADLIINNFQEQCRKAGLKSEAKKVIGKISETIITEAQNFDLVVMARKGEHLHFKEGGLLGSVAESVVRHSSKPVMITPDDYREIESMGIAYDGSPSAQKALALSFVLSKQASWPVTAVIITEDMEKSSQLTRQIDEEAQKQEIDCEPIVLPGKEGTEILNFINEDAVELMVMGAYGHNRLRQLLLGSTTSQVIQKSHIPILLTRYSIPQ